MAKESQNSLESSHDVRVAATSKIWGTTVGILALCIPLSAVTRSGAILPLAAIGGAAAGTVAVWRADEKKSKPNYLQQQQIELLETRIANLETIISSNDFDLHMKIQQLEASDRAKQTLPEHQA
jgi:TolA-binding protein